VIPTNLFTFEEASRTFKVDANYLNAGTSSYRSWFGDYIIYFSVGFFNYPWPPAFKPQEFSFPATIVPDCANAAFTGFTSIATMQTYLNTPFTRDHVPLSHNEFTIFNYYCEKGLTNVGIYYQLTKNDNSPFAQTFLKMTVSLNSINFYILSTNPSEI
jgi:hypothetical protein